MCCFLISSTNCSSFIAPSQLFETDEPFRLVDLAGAQAELAAVAFAHCRNLDVRVELAIVGGAHHVGPVSRVSEAFADWAFRRGDFGRSHVSKEGIELTLRSARCKWLRGTHGRGPLAPLGP